MLDNPGYALLSANAYATSKDVVSPNNAIPMPTGWSALEGFDRNNQSTGFLANVYTNGAGDIVIAYAGTTDNSLDWLMGNVPAATGLTLAPQVTDAAKLYLDVLTDNPNANITFTGHSLGGGLASLMAVYFNRQATTFDEAPFEKSADSGRVVDALKKELILSGYTLPPEFASYAALYYIAGTFIPSPTRVTRESNVSHIYLKDEVLSLLQTPQGKIAATVLGLSIGSGAIALLTTGVANIAGPNEQVIDAKATNGNGWGWPLLNGQPVDLHYMPLLAAFLQSPELLAASRNTPEVLQKIFTSKLTAGNTQDRDQQNFINLMVQQEAQGNASWSAFAGDIGRLKGEVSAGPIKAALVGLDIGMQYGQGMDHVNGIVTGAFESAFKDVTGGIQFAPNSEHSEWLSDSLDEFRRKLPTLYADIGAVGNKFTESTERYTLATTGAMNVTAAADGKSDFMLGSINADTLNGSDGGDVLLGRGGVDTLDGGSGWDTLIGGKDDDNLNGGSGFDRYLYQLGDGSDLIEDVDGGSIQIFGNDTEYVFGGLYLKQEGGETWIGEASNHTVTIQHAGEWTVSSDDGAIVRFADATDLGDFAMKLVDDQAIAAPTTRTIIGDLQPLDFDLSKPDIQTQTDALGNIVLDASKPAPGRADSFNDSAGNDLIQGLGGNDSIAAFHGGSDRIEGGDGDDWVIGGDWITADTLSTEADDVLIGGAGRDVLQDGTGNNKLYADGVVTLIEALAAENATPSGLQGEALYSGQGNDLAIGGVGNDALLGGLGNDILVGGAGDDDINGDFVVGNIRPDWSVTRTITADANGATTYGTSYNQFWYLSMPTTGGADAIYAGAGADWVSAGNGNDYIDGGNDADVLFGEAGNDDLFGGEGNDRINGDTASLPLSAHGDDYLDGEDGEDVLDGGGGQDQLFGGTGADSLYSRDGDDYLDGEDDDDLLLGGTGGDQLFGGDGNDQIAGDNGGYDTSGEADNIHGEAGNDVIDGQGGGDVIDGGADNDLVAGGLGDDQIAGGSGADQLQGGEGNDILDGGSESDTLFGEAGDDTLIGDAGTDQLQGGDGNDIFDGGSDADTLFGEAGNDTLRGGAGTDYLIGGLGDDILDGGEGNDVYYYRMGEGRDRIVDSGGTDWLVFNDITWGQLRLGTGSLKLSLPDGSEIHLDDFDPDNPYAAGGIEYFQFADYTVMTKNQLIDVLGIAPTGTPEADLLSGTALAENIDALAGDDIVTARAGDDTIQAGDGADVVYAGDGNDVVFGGNGDDVLLGEAGNDTLQGEAGNDLLAGGAGTDQLQGGDGDDSYLFQTGDGQDTAIDALGSNAVVLGAGLTLDAITFTRQGSDLLVVIRNSSDRLTVRDWYAADSRFAGLTLGDGTLLDHAGVEAAMPRNQAPLVAADSATVSEDNVINVSGNVLGNDSDPEGRALRVTNAGSYAGAVGSLALGSDGAFTYSLANGSSAVQSLGAGQSLTETFTYAVTDDDPNGAATAESTIRISVLGTNDLPVLGADSAATSEDAAPITGNLLANDRDVDADTVLSIANPGAKVGAYGTLTLAADGTYSYSLANTSTAVQALAAGQVVTESFAQAVSDGIAQVGGNLILNIAGRNDAPILASALADQSAAANTSWTWALPAGSFTDIDAGDVLGYGATLADGTALPSWLAFDAATQTFSGRVPKSATGSIDIRVAATDGAGAIAADVFTLSFASGGGGGGGGGGGDNGGGGGSQGNEGVGNGVDAPPPGHDISFNDGVGSGPGNPGAQGGDGYRPPSLADIEMSQVQVVAPIFEAPAAMANHGNSTEAHAAAPGQASQADAAGTALGAAATEGGAPLPAAVSPAPIFSAEPSPSETAGKSAAAPALAQGHAVPNFGRLLAAIEASASPQGNTAAPSAGADEAAIFARWLAVEQALARDSADAMPEWLDRARGADLRGLLVANGGFVGSNQTFGTDMIGLLAGAGLKGFKGLAEGVQKIV